MPLANSKSGAQPVSERMLALAELAPGQRVLDLASGIGEPAASAARVVGPAGQALATLARLLDSTSYQNVLARGFAVVRGPGGLITAPDQASAGLELDIEFARDQHLPAVAGGGGARRARAKAVKKPKRQAEVDPQGRLL